MDDNFKNLPHVMKWKDRSFDLHDPFGRLKRSDFQYFYCDKEAGMVAGYWEAEDGHEDLGEESFHELLFVMEGKLYIYPKDSDEEIIAEPMDTFICKSGRPVRLTVKEPVKVFFICYPLDNIEEYAAMCKGKQI